MNIQELIMYVQGDKRFLGESFFSCSFFPRPLENVPVSYSRRMVGFKALTKWYALEFCFECWHVLGLYIRQLSYKVKRNRDGDFYGDVFTTRWGRGCSRLRNIYHTKINISVQCLGDRDMSIT